MLVSFVRDETVKAGLKRAVIGVSGGIDSAVTAALASEALGPDNVLGLFTPYRRSSDESRLHAQAVSKAFGFRLEEVPITKQVDAYFADNGGDTADRIRVGNKMARERKSIEYDRSWPDGIVIGTSNKTELLLGYGTRYGDMACDLNPVGDLFKKYYHGWQLRVVMMAAHEDDASRKTIKEFETKDNPRAEAVAWLKKKGDPESMLLADLVERYGLYTSLNDAMLYEVGHAFRPLDTMKNVDAWTDDYSDVLRVMTISEVQWLRKLAGLPTPDDK